MIRTYANRTPEVTELERRNSLLARRASCESIVLLKNEGALPIKPGPIALYGEGATHTIKGGTGSGEVNARYTVGIREGLESAGFSIETSLWLDDYEETRRKAEKKYISDMRRLSGFKNFKAIPYLLSHPFAYPPGRPILRGDIVTGVQDCFYVITRQSGEDVDRKPELGDLCLTDLEVRNIRMCTQNYDNTTVVINVGGMVDLSPLDGLDLQGIIFFGQQGGEGGHAFADLISGKVSPSARLSFSWPMKYDDIPFGESFSFLGDTAEEDYREGIYVGYRYFDSFGIEPRYPFGFGLSFTQFSMETVPELSKRNVILHTTVTNRGEYSGKAVVQVYASCPAGRLDKEYQRLAGFCKTKTLSPGESETVAITFDGSILASYDTARSQMVLEPGDYTLRVGESSHDTDAVAVLRFEREIVLSEHESILPRKKNFEELRSLAREGDASELPALLADPDAFATVVHSYPEFGPFQSSETDLLMNTFTEEEKLHLCIGAGMDLAMPKPRFFMLPGAAGFTTSALETKGIPSVALCDGPSGLRVNDVSVIRRKSVRMVRPVMAFMRLLPLTARLAMFGRPVKGKTLYQYTTAFPVGMCMAQSWNVELLEEIGKAIQAEMEAFGAVYWLAPGINIHRNPLCGRNYEYYSEDPLLSGKLAAAIIKGVQQKEGYYATLKHFAANNQETNRKVVSSNVSERALREIYLRGFEIAVREAKPSALMTSYNRINGVYASESHDLCTKVLRNEWGFDGVVMTDWVTKSNLLDSAKCMKAGVNLMMPGIKTDYAQIEAGRKDGLLSSELIHRNASYVLGSIVKSDIYKICQTEHEKKE